MKLYAPKDDVRGQKVQIVAAFLDIQLRTPLFVLGEHDKEADFVAKSPLGRLPVLESELGGGVVLFGSNAICRFLARLRPDKCLYGATLGEQGQVDMWIDFCTLEVEVPMSCLIQGGSLAERAREDVRCALGAVDSHLKTRTYMVGEHISIADLCLASILIHGLRFMEAHADLFFSDCKYVRRWFETISHQKAFEKIFGNIGAVTAGKQPARKGGSAKATDALSDEDDEKPRKPKKLCELDLLPPSSMALDEWKRVYSNTKDLYGVAMKWFWEHFDNQGYSLWYMKYQKLEDECRIAFLTSNQLSGFLQRIESDFRKYSFGVIDVIGVEPNFEIEGVWLFRGTAIPAMMMQHPSFEYNTWQKLNAADPGDRKKVEAFWCASDAIDGVPIADSKVWK